MPIKKIMTKEVISFEPQMSLEDVFAIMYRNRISGGPVVDENGDMVGVISDADLIRAMAPNLFKVMTLQSHAEDKELMREIQKRLKRTLVKDVMSPHVEKVVEAESIVKVAAIMASKNLKHMPVMKEGTAQVAGWVSRRDLLRAMFSRLGLSG